MELTVNTEAISPRAVSPFAAELTAIFKDADDARKMLAENGKDVIAGSIKYFKKHCHDRIIQAVKKHTGLTIGTLSYSKQLDFHNSCRLRCFNDETLVTVMNRMVANVPPPKWFLEMYNIAENTKTVEELEALASNLDKMTGRFDLSSVKLETNESLVCDINIDLHELLCIPETCHSKLERRTPQENAATLLHEIGHQFSMLEMAKYQWHLHKVSMTGIYSFAVNGDVSEHTAFIKKHKQEISKDATDAELKDLVDKYSEGVVTGTVDKVRSQPDQSNDIGDVVEAVASYVAFGVISILAIPYMVFTTTLQFLFESVALLGYNSGADWNIKLSDLGRNTKQVSTVEQLADRYVSEHGMGHHMASGLYKKVRAMESCGAPSVRNSTTYLTIATALSQFFMMCYDDERYSGYETDVNRIQRFIENNIEILKNSDLPELHKKALVEQITAMQELKKESKKHGLPKWYGTFLQAVRLIRKVFDAPNVASQLFDAGFRIRYNDLVERMEKLNNNPLYYRAAQLETGNR
jgi:hypothetical protein